MFTGLVQHLGHLERIARQGATARLTVRADLPSPDIGESIAVNGVCLTLVSHGSGCLSFDVLGETLDRTALGTKSPGAPLHLERALRAGDPLGGHFVTGHVDGTGTLVSGDITGSDRVLLVRTSPALLDGIVPKGSVAIDGVSLTVVELDRTQNLFGVHLIPHTWTHTAFPALPPGALLNIETDLLGKFARQSASSSSSSPPAPPPLTLDRLRSAGFL
ncbi:MAG: riboflavin synthase [Kiritimatiellae bacterium]|nr:riboflavin synthase [Kiritimatiellia bacterium]